MNTFEILTVCSGNICRSPLAEQLLRSSLSIPDLVVSSAGTVARDGDEMTPQSQALSRRYGGDPSAHQARYLQPPHIAGARLVFAMSREHRRKVVTMLPRASKYTFTLREFARLADGITAADLRDFGLLPTMSIPERLDTLVALVASRRGFVAAPQDPEDDDIIDPYRRDDAVYELSAQQMVPALEVVGRTLVLAARGGE